MKYIYIVLLTIGLLFSCEERPVEIPPWTAPTGNKTVLVEDLTGVGCTNCPTGAATLESLVELYGEEKLIVVSVHGGTLFTDPVETDDYNLRNKFADDIDDLLSPHAGKPAIGIDRTNGLYSTFFGVPGVQNWTGLIDDAFKEELLIDIGLSSTWDEVSRKITINVLAIPKKEELNGNYNIGVMLLESGIETVQKGPQGEIEDYEHHNVLRHMLTSAKGQSLQINNEPVTTSFQHTLQDEDGTGWKADHMSIVTFITDADTYQVIQSKIVPVVN